MDTSCPEAPFERIECLNDRHISEKRPFSNYLFTDRDTAIAKFCGKMMDWRSWDLYIPQFVCRCAKAAKARGATFFGMQFYGKLAHKLLRENSVGAMVRGIPFSKVARVRFLDPPAYVDSVCSFATLS